MKERVKSIILVLLVISNCILGTVVLSNGKLWSGSGYNFFNEANFISILNSIFHKKQTQKTHLESPESIIVNTGYQTSRVEIKRNSENFEDVYQSLKPYLLKAFSSQSHFSESSNDELYSSLSSRSVYLLYPVHYNTDLFSYLLGGTKPELQALKIKDIIISPDSTVYVVDDDTKKVYKTHIDKSSSDLNNLIESYKDVQSDNIINYAFDLGFDDTQNGQKAVISPITPVYSDTFTLPVIYSENPLSAEYDDSVIDNILKAFGMKSGNSLRHYMQADSTSVYVENNAVLKISPNGLLTYTSNDGYPLSKNTYSNENNSIAFLSGFIDNVNSASGCNSSVCFASDIATYTKTIRLDYVIDGNRVIVNSGEQKNAISVRIENGKILSYSQILRNYYASDETVNVSDYITALDNILSRNENELDDIEINKLAIVYPDDSSIDAKTPIWSIALNDNTSDK